MLKFFILFLLFIVFVRSQHPPVTEKQYIHYPILHHVFLSGMLLLHWQCVWDLCHVEK